MLLDRQINTWDHEEFDNAVKASGKKQLIIAGVGSEGCVIFPVLFALTAGYGLFVIPNVSGTLTTWFGAANELHRHWRNDMEGLGALFSSHILDDRNRISRYSTLTAASEK